MPGPVAQGRPLNPAQRGVWFAQRLDPRSPVYNMGGFLDIRGPVDSGLLQAALTALVAEDEATRLRFTEVDGEPVQHLGPVCGFTAPLLDLSAETDPVAAADRVMRRDLETVPDLEKGPLFSHLLLRVGPERLFWYSRSHHLVHDGYTSTIMRQRLAELYTGLTGRQPGRAGRGRVRLAHPAARPAGGLRRICRAAAGRLVLAAADGRRDVPGAAGRRAGQPDRAGDLLPQPRGLRAAARVRRAGRRDLGRRP